MRSNQEGRSLAMGRGTPLSSSPLPAARRAAFPLLKSGEGAESNEAGEVLLYDLRNNAQKTDQ